MSKHLTQEEKQAIPASFRRLCGEMKKKDALNHLADLTRKTPERIRQILRESGGSLTNEKQTSTGKSESISNDVEDLLELDPPTFKVNLPVQASEDYEVKRRKPKILLFDIETAPNTTYVWGHYEQNALKHLRQSYMLAFCAKWIDGETISRCLPDYAAYKPNTDDDRALVEDLWNLFDEADVIVGHNGDAFDIKKTNARFVIHGLKPPAPYRTIDTKKVARRYFRFNSNKLDDLGNTLGVGRKIKHTGFELWDDCINGDLEAWELMRMYNRQDVLLLERVYLKLCPFMQNHPNMSILSEIEDGCPVCASTDLVKQGFSVTPTGKKRRYHCQTCGAWSVGKHRKITDIR